MQMRANAELRGVEKKTSQKGNSYFAVNLEDSGGNPFRCMSRENLFDGLKKGDMLKCTFDCTFGQYPHCYLIQCSVMQ